MATWQTIEDMVERLSILQRNSPSAPERVVIVEEWAVTFAEVPDADFLVAVRRARLKTAFFPAEHDIGRELRLMAEERKTKASQTAQALPMGKPSQEYLDKVKLHSATILAMVRRNVDARSGRA